ncbi:hypothetical protein AB0G04_14115 [Actinoplanes sp. NPDC023801]|uniref:hypothetical protein n=1 Tax=Actinoplanes sp. NPDC023801 TaxID=3154595 RepID=UPI0033E4A44A
MVDSGAYHTDAWKEHMERVRMGGNGGGGCGGCLLVLIGLAIAGGIVSGIGWLIDAIF